MSCVSSDLIGTGNNLFPDSLFSVMRKALYIQCITSGAATLSFSIFTEACKINEREKKPKRTQNKKINKNSRASKLDNMNASNTFSKFLSYCQTKLLKI